MKKVIRLDEPKEEKQPKPIELTHYVDGGRWFKSVVEPSKYERIVYLGNDIEDGDLFAGYHKLTITLYKGHLNDGVY